ncbi:zinc ABC transporter substrate-binding protein [Saccharospirillum impatiens]|uniref:zinc ABC transporter substrate-binding protein n=1 Tax=Saccharospirillum impatiens TaxID=169438 RepID=UPI00042A38ED|nr:zinc ABC transporter substrate-binding protein [Saccharospirillum impatiens]
MLLYRKLACWARPLAVLMVIMSPVGAETGPPRVLVSIAPLHSLVAQVMAGVAEPELVYETRQSPHSSAMTPRQLKAVVETDLLFWIGPELETALARLLPRLRDDAQAFDLHDFDGGMTLLPMRDTLFSESEIGDEHDHDHGDLDPHVWLSLDNARVFVDFVEARLVEHDPDNRSRYQRNADQTRTRLAGLGEQIDRHLETSRETPYILFHDGFQYFEQDQSLNGLGALVLNPDIPPGPRTIARLRDLAAPYDRVCLFREPQYSERWLLPLVNDLDKATLGTIDPLGQLSEPGAGLYADMMLRLASDLAACLGDT